MFLNRSIKKRKLSALRQFVNKAPADIINLGLGEIRFGLHPKIREILRETIVREEFYYTPNAGLKELRDIIANQYDKDASVCVTCGAEEAVFATLFSVLEHDDEVLISNPGYPAYGTITEMLGAKPKYFNLDKNNGFMLDRESLLKSISCKTKVIIVTNPSNPIGNAFSEDEIDFIKKVARKNNILIVADEIYRELYLHIPIKSLFSKDDNIVVINGLSKAFAMSGWRLGWAVSSNKDLIRGITVAHQYIATCAPTISQKVAVKILQNSDMITMDIRERLLRGFNMVLWELVDTKRNFPLYQAAPYLFFNVFQNDVHFAERLLKKGVLVIPGSFFGSNGKGWIRINYAQEFSQLKKAVTVIKTELKR